MSDFDSNFRLVLVAGAFNMQDIHAATTYPS